MKSVTFCFATHNHQPIGNFDNIIEEAYERSYLPFFELVEKYPIRFATHMTGILLDWLQQKHPEYISRLRGLVERGTLEMIGGGYYEPILSVIPPRDQQAQIAKLSNWIQQNLNYSPTGMWLAERVWEQPLASALHDAGMKYVLLDDTHFLATGLRETDLDGYYLTEDLAKTLAVFPISKPLRYTIPFAAVDETIRVLKDAASEDGKHIVCFADDGEKFGVWPRTFDHVYKDGWLDEFFRKLMENKDWLHMKHLSEVVRDQAPKGRIYLPNASYAEMMQWAFPTAKANQDYETFVHLLEEDKAKWEEYIPFVRGGYWRNFFVKYPETNQLHKHMLRTSERIAQLTSRGTDSAEAYTSLLAAQCNDPYWHGVFGGAYLTNLRHANFSALVKADAMIDEAEQLKGVHLSTGDFECDGFEDLILESPEFSLFIKPSEGGMIAELDLKARSFNAMNTITRRPEAYHRKITEAAQTTEEGGSKSIHDIVEAKESGLEKLLIYDPYRHGCLIEHFLSPNVTIDEFREMTFVESGNVVTSVFEWGWNGEDRALTMTCRGKTTNAEGGSDFVLSKTIQICEEERALKVTYLITNESPEILRLRFASEWLFNLLAGSAHDRYYEVDGKRLEHSTLDSTGILNDSQSIRMVDEYLKLGIDISAPSSASIWRVPVESVSLSEAGFERVYQGSIVMPLWDLQIVARETSRVEMTVSFVLYP